MQQKTNQRESIAVLFVCTGNTCRSPMAEALARKMADERRVAMEFRSAGIAAWDGGRISDHAETILRKYGIDGSAHKAQMITREHIEWADVVLTMTEQHRKIVIEQFPGQQEKVYNLAAFLYNRSENVPDPYGGSLDVYEACATSLEQMIKDLFDRLLANNKTNTE